MKHNFKLLSFVLLFCITFLSCKKGFLDVNSDPNRVTDDNITPELIFTQAEVAVGDRQVGSSSEFAGLTNPLQFVQDWIGYMAPNGDYVPLSQEINYNLDYSFGDLLFRSYYNVLFDLHQSEVKGLASGDTALSAASIILSAKLFQDVVDLYGDIPYSEAFSHGKTTHPKYDKAQDIYNALQLRLDDAIKYMNKPVAGKFVRADVINGGNATRWIKFANTLKLRLLIRQSQVATLNYATEIAKINANGGVLGSGETISVNPGYVNSINKQSPFYAIYGYSPIGNRSITADNANAYIINILNNNNDPREAQLFTSVGGKYVGAKYGDQQINLPKGINASYFGPGIVGSASQNQWIIPSYESLFYKAEAIAQGWMAGDVKQAYQDAVTESFVFLGVPDAVNAAANYMSTASIANWNNAGTDKASQVKFIAYQKYIANTAIDALESYADQRRLHFLPDNGYISISPAVASNSLPLRLLYPQSEYTTNAENVNKVGTINIFTSKIFWQP